MSRAPRPLPIAGQPAPSPKPTPRGPGRAGPPLLAGIAVLVQDVDALGGSERQARLLAEELTVQGERVCLLSTNGQGPLGRPRGAWRERRKGVATYRLPLLGFEAAAGALLARERPEVLYAVGLMLGAFAGRLGRLLDAPVVVKLACSGPWGDVAALDALPPGTRAAVLADLADATVICLSEDLAREADAAGLGRARVLLPNGVPPPPPGAPVRPAGPGVPTVLFVGRLDRQKGVDVLLEAFARCQGGAHLLLAGEGPERAALEAQAARLGLAERVTFLGRRADVWGLLRGATVCCLPSRSEGISNALLEALAAGVPVVVSGIPANVEVVGADEAAGLIAAPEDPADLARALSRALGDEALRARLSAAALARVEERYALEAVARAHRELFAGLPRPPRPSLARVAPRFLRARAASLARALGRVRRS
ncbi:MAG: glycosyltransferase family 4 protein [Planctomycetota bacterium]